MEWKKYRRFMVIANAFAQMSKVENVKVGALILDDQYVVRGSGWNGAPRMCSADEDHRMITTNTPGGNPWMAHAEANAIAQAAKSGTSTDRMTLVVTHAPCMACARLIVQAGFIRLVCNEPQPPFSEKWATEIGMAKELFRECGVHYIELGEV